MKILESDFQAWMGGIQARMEAVLARLLPAAHVAPARLHEAMRYATLEGGKRVRPLLAFGAGELSGATPERLEIAAAAVELMQDRKSTRLNSSHSQISYAVFCLKKKKKKKKLIYT